MKFPCTPDTAGVYTMSEMRESRIICLYAGGAAPEMNMDKKEAKAWRDIWSAGHGVGGIDAVMPTQALVAELGADFDCALGELQRWRAHAPAPAREKVA